MNHRYLASIVILSSVTLLPTAAAFSVNLTSNSQSNIPVANQLSLAQVTPQLAVIPPQWRNNQPPNQPALTGIAGKIDKIAQQITLRIDSKNQPN